MCVTSYASPFIAEGDMHKGTGPRHVAKGYSQVEGLDFDETYTPVARLESFRILLAYATYHGFKLYQMDVKRDRKSTRLNCSHSGESRMPSSA